MEDEGRKKIRLVKERKQWKEVAGMMKYRAMEGYHIKEKRETRSDNRVIDSKG